MTIRNFFTASLLLGILTALATAPVATAQGTGTPTPLLTGFIPMPEHKLQEGYVRVFDNTSMFGWGGQPRDSFINRERLNFTGRVADTPFFFLGYPVVPWHVMHGTATARPQGTMTPLFDGETLDGWSIRGNVQAVVEDGVLILTGGSGSLESDGTFANFILQLEYYTPVRPEGQGVNSGVFFRCIPGQTMNGYECQILNNPSARDYENFIGTRTGGIFRRQAGRNVGAQDGEWNYLTISVRGPRMATWVNGIQVTNWTDERWPHENPRNGLRLEAGTIQFQGHDARTEVRFRNIRILEL